MIQPLKFYWTICSCLPYYPVAPVRHRSLCYWSYYRKVTNMAAP